MDIFIAGSAHVSAQLRMQNQWNMRRQGGNASAQTSGTSEQQLVSTPKQQAADAPKQQMAHTQNRPAADMQDQPVVNAPEQSDTDMDAFFQTMEKSDEEYKKQSITWKAFAGKRLTAEEKRYLRQTDAMAYERLNAIEQEQKAYERALKRCRSKEDVQRLKMSRLGSSLTAVKAVGSSGMGDDRKITMLALENRRCNMLARSTNEYIRTGGYKKWWIRREWIRTPYDLWEDWKQQNDFSEECGQTEEVQPPQSPTIEEQLPQPPTAGEQSPTVEEHPSASEGRGMHRLQAEEAYTAWGRLLQRPTTADINVYA